MGFSSLALALSLGLLVGAHLCPISQDSCLGDAQCQWNPVLSQCMSSLPCALETNREACGQNSWGCGWNRGSCSAPLVSSAFAPNMLRCVSLKSEQSCKQDIRCTWGGKTCQRRPTIVLSLADDLGNYDVGWNNPRARTPVLDALRTGGVSLERHYTARFCAPTRAMLLTGVHPWKLGLQTDLNLNPVYSMRCSSAAAAAKRMTRLLPEILRSQAGYSTHMLGKWHLGNSRDTDLPTSRGFDSFIGYYGGGIENQGFGPLRFRANQCACASRKRAKGYGRCKTYSARAKLFCVFPLAMVNDTSGGQHVAVNPSTVREESADLFFASQAVDLMSTTPPNKPLFLYLSWSTPHNPVFAPDRFVDLVSSPFGTDAKLNKFCPASGRRTQLAMVTMLDEAHRVVVDGLERTGRFSDSIFVFISDNGGNSAQFTSRGDVRKCSYGMNYPLRGTKFTWWEGGVRTIGFVHSQANIPAQSSFSQLVSAADWKQTLLDGAGLGRGDEQDDSVSKWKSFTGRSEEQREELPLQVWLEQQRFVILFKFGNELYKVIRGYPFSGTGAGNVGRQDRGFAASAILQPPELPSSELFGHQIDNGRGMTCINRLCLFNLDVDPFETDDLGAEESPARTQALQVIGKYSKEGGKVTASGLCESSRWYPTRAKDATDKNALVFARKCGMFSAWLEESGKVKTSCG